jgi:outer membrane receptor protein involved in Fe transport
LGFRGAAPVDGTESVFELYSEALVPIIDSQVTSHYLGAELGVRYSSYDHADSVWTWKAGLDWRPKDWLGFRAMFQHAVRAPNNGELFTEQFTEISNGFPDPSFDPCSASNDPDSSGNAEKCILQGLPSEQIGVFEAQAFYPQDVIRGGNPALEPESSDTTTVGVVLSPEIVDGLTVAVDFFEAEVTGTIGGISPGEICFDPQNTGHAFCENIRRDATGNVAEVVALVSNRGLRLARGIDTQIQYQLELPTSLALFDGAADLGLGISWTHMLDYEDQENVATRILECTGLFGDPCGDTQNSSFPENRVTGNFNYTSGPLTMHLTWRWIDGMLNAAPLSSDYMQHPDPKLAVPDVPSYSYFDLGLGYLFQESLQVRFGINNLFDKDPPQMASAVFDNNTDSGFYDVFGRTFYISMAWNSLP